MGRLLWIDNDARLVGLVATLLERQGHIVRTAGNFAEARQLIAAERPDLMLSDLDLGAETGRAELPRLAAEGLLPPTLIVSGFLDRELDLELCAIPGVLGTLAKPFDLDRLCERIEAALAELAGPQASTSPVAGTTVPDRADPLEQGDRPGSGERSDAGDRTTQPAPRSLSAGGESPR